MRKKKEKTTTTGATKEMAKTDITLIRGGGGFPAQRLFGGGRTPAERA